MEKLLTFRWEISAAVDRFDSHMSCDVSEWKMRFFPSELSRVSIAACWDELTESKQFASLFSSSSIECKQQAAWKWWWDRKNLCHMFGCLRFRMQNGRKSICVFDSRFLHVDILYIESFIMCRPCSAHKHVLLSHLFSSLPTLIHVRQFFTLILHSSSS